MNATAIQVIQFAYELPDFRILSAPDWSRSARYDIVAKSDPALADQLHSIPYGEARLQLQKMIQSLLAERFHLAAHMETRTLPIYDLMVAKGGPKLSPGKDGPKHVDSTGRGGSVTMTVTNSSHAAADLAEMLYRYTGRVVVDKTGLNGNYTFALRFANDESRTGMPSMSEATTAIDTGPSVFTALKEQLGLELKSGKGPVEVLVIEHIDPPTEN